jgi:hypothetical protein
LSVIGQSAAWHPSRPVESSLGIPMRMGRAVKNQRSRGFPGDFTSREAPVGVARQFRHASAIGQRALFRLAAING